MACDAQTLVNLATTNRAGALSRRGLAECIAAQAAQHGGGTPFSPIQLAGLFQWFDASDNTTMLVGPGIPCGNGDSVNIWKDKSGNGRDLSTVPEFASAPTYSFAEFNGKNAALFPITSALEGDALGPDLPFSVFAVGTVGSIDGSQKGMVGFQSAMFYVDEPGNEGSFTWYGGGATHTQSAGGLISVNTLFSIGVTSDGVSTPVLYKSGVAVGYTPPTDTGGSPPSDGATILGARADDASFPYEGKLCEVVIVGAIISAGDRASLQAYFASKWGL